MTEMLIPWLSCQAEIDLKNYVGDTVTFTATGYTYKVTGAEPYSPLGESAQIRLILELVES